MWASRILSRNLLRQRNVRNLILGIESSCDDSGAAIIDQNSHEIKGEALSSQLTARFGGVIPSFAMRNHTIDVPFVVETSLKQANLESFDQVDAVAVTNRPGLTGSLLIGTRYAQYLCHKHKKPLIPIHHMEAHALTARLIDDVPFPFMVLLISGGHCLLAMAQDVNKFLLLGHSIDNSPGELLDKVARRLKIHMICTDLRDVSGGRAIEVMAKDGDPHAFPFPSPLSADSFGGLRTQSETWIKKLEQKVDLLPDQLLSDVPNFCARVLRLDNLANKLSQLVYGSRVRTGRIFSLEFCVASHLSRRLQRAIEFADLKHLWQNGSKTLVVSGGVACNSRIRSTLQKVCDSYDCKIVCPPPKYCTDNGVMIAWNGVEKWNHQKLDIIPWQKVFDLEIHPRVPFGQDISDQVASANIKCENIRLSS